jgi:cytochrome c oxidase cbb3-type subunit 3
MKINKYLLLGSSIGVFALLVFAALQENYLKEWRHIQASGRADEGPIPVQLRQIVNTSLGISDRCVSCHVTMGPGEQETGGTDLLVAHKPVVHDPSQFGCTPCHGGQGQATEKEDAHGKVPFWPEPMLERRFSYAGCGSCHAPLGVPEQEQFREAQAAFERLDCHACHRVDGRGGTLRPDGGGMEGPDLSRAGMAVYDANWHEKHLQKAGAAREGPWKNSFPPVSDGDRALLKMYMSTRVAAPALVEAKSVFLASGCLGCHKVSGVGGDEGLDLTRAGEKDPGQVSFKDVPGEATMANWMAEHLRAPASVVAGSLMPPVPFPEQEIDQLTFYTLSLRRREFKDSYVPKDRIRATRFGEREFAADGATIFGAFCTGCHGRDGLGRKLPGLVSFPAIGNPDFLALAADEFITLTVKNGRPGRRMPGWVKDGGLRPEEIQAVVAQVRKLGKTAAESDPRPARWVSADAAAGKRLFESICAGCHGAQGRGGEGPALNNKVLLGAATDTYLVETISRGRRATAMAGFLTPSPTRPALSRAEIETVVAYLRSFQGAK